VSGEYNIKIVAANPFRNNGGPDCKLVRVFSGSEKNDLQNHTKPHEQD